MNILKILFVVLIILVVIRMGLDFFDIQLSMKEGMTNKKKCTSKKEKVDNKEQFPKANPHMAQNTGRKVPDNSIQHKYKKYAPNDLDELPVKSKQYIEMGKNFLEDESRKRKEKIPQINNSDAEVLGKMVWRTYVAEMEQKRSNSPKAHDEVLSREIQLMNKISELLKSESDHHKGKGKKHQSITNQASSVSSRCAPKHHIPQHTNNMYTHIPKAGNNIKREDGYAFKGKPIPGSPKYYDLSNAVDHCASDRACGGVNFDSTTGQYMLMPIHAKLGKKPHFTAYIKKQHNSKQKKQTHNKHTHPVTQQDYLPVTGIGSPMSPNVMPRPYNSIYDLF